METSIKISVIIPVYNTARYLPNCLDSLREQAYRNVEFILVDDGSKDNSLEICRSYAETDDRFVVIAKENGGPSSARNLAISKARGEYITFVDSDDFVDTDTYTEIAALLEKHENPDCLVFGAHLIPDNASQHLYGLVNTRDVVYTEFSPAVLFSETGARPFLWLQVMKRSVIEENNIKMDESIKLGEDQLFQMEFFPHTKKVVFTSKKFYNYRWRRVGSIMHETAEKKLKKLLLHVDLVDKVFTKMEQMEQSEEMLEKTLIWSIFFLWGDIAYILEEEQSEVAAALVKVWEKHNFRALEENLDVWCKVRMEHIVLMGEEDKEARISAYVARNEELEEKIKELEASKDYEKIALFYAENLNPFQRVRRSLRLHGFRGTVKKVTNKITGKKG